jgi:hypothetical protein
MARARATLSRHPRTYSRQKEEVHIGIPSGEALSPRILSKGIEIHTTTSWHLWERLRATSRPLTTGARALTRIPLLAAHRRSSELAQTRVVRRSPPSSFLKEEHEGRIAKDSRDSDRPHAREARGLDHRNLNLEGSKASPRPGFDSCPRVIELGTTEGAPVHGQGSSHALEAPQDVFEAKGGGPHRNPLGGDTEPSNPVTGNQDPHDHFLASLGAPLGH